MSDRRIQRLAPVVDLATRAERDAARVLGQAQQKLLQSENQLRDLQRYLSDYQQQWLTSGRQGVSGQWMVNYQRFLGQLDTAIEQQGRSVEWNRDNLRKARERWQQCHMRLEGLRKLVQRYQDEARRVADAREQKQFDELAQRMLVRRED
ncbi:MULTISPECIES: flagellar export protein FliJ [Pseudomonas]|uniref:Flagellar FliJ protein n=1 Tax=Pseudomonas flexibilis TaxID=706570 RepID=A0A0B3BYP9_9PSED|nr:MULTISPECIES: flagellar export protein FliJ [Pseudomonas]KHL70638.1 flagellar biosynthesis chaperone [Pseudomonas flexibilis]KHO66156.1 flagellar biogenesis protein [Pseudomonas flexibilis]SCY44985.1 flagellar FliJ protein [Pseudomonas flexibilis]SIR14600.1 flagellar FliJ protein [Pseudomonas flexibilis]